MKSHQLINQTSGDFEYYTPKFIIDAARNTMVTIHLDPASSAIANKRVRADAFYTEEMDGLSMNWYGNVFLNHPFSRVNNPKWINFLVDQYHKDNVNQFCCITYACTSETWFRPLLKFPQCWLSPRTNYVLPNGTIKKGVPKGSVVTYGGPDRAIFKRFFSPYGYVK